MARGSANMWWIIIGAIVALVVMVILLGFFTESGSTVNKGLLECSSKGGKCLSADECSDAKGTSSDIFAGSCEVEGQVCCFGGK